MPAWVPPEIVVDDSLRPMVNSSYGTHANRPMEDNMQDATPLELDSEDMSMYRDERDGEFKTLSDGEHLVSNEGDGVWITNTLGKHGMIEQDCVCFSLREAKEYIKQVNGKHVKYFNRNY